MAIAVVLFGIGIAPQLDRKNASKHIGGEPAPVDSYWQNIAWLQKQLRPGDTVWLQPNQHPIAAFDASYYWFGFHDMLPYTVGWSSKHPDQPYVPYVRGAEDMPVCRLLRGEEPRLRFVSNDAMSLAPDCLRQLIASGRLQRAPVPFLPGTGIYAVVDSHSSTAP